MKAETPLVSIGLITRNRSLILPLAIKMLLAQSYKNIELIISDNASTDKTEEICLNFSRKDKRIRYVRQKKNLGMYRNFNFVLRQAKGMYFMWATDDDEWHKDYILNLVYLLERHDQAVVATSNYILFNDRKNQRSKIISPPFIPFPQSLFKFQPYAVLVTYGLIRTKILKKVGGFHHYSWPIPDGIGDATMVFKILLKGGVAFSQQTLLSKKDSGFAMDRFDVVKRLKISRVVLQKILRYPKFLFLYFFDFSNSVNATLQERLSIRVKLILLLFCFKQLNINLYFFISDWVRGSFYFVLSTIGFFLRFIKKWLFS